MNIKQFWKAVLAQDEEEIRKYFHKDAYVNWHCTNEHFTVDEYIIANCEYPGEWDGIIERTEMVNELIITVTQISPHYDSRRRTNYAQKTSLTNSWFVFFMPLVSNPRNRLFLHRNLQLFRLFHSKNQMMLLDC